MTTAQMGLMGLAVMGQNLVLNMARNGYTVAVFNRTTAVTEEFVAAHPDSRLVATRTFEEFVASLERPRRILIMVKAGAAVDAVIDGLLPLLEKGDLIMDGGNSYFQDTDRRSRAMADRGLHFMGVGVSGGEEGALWGPSIMPGGTPEAWALVADLMQAIAAKAPEDGRPCVAYLGPGSAGHYVKMVHNGIEYGDMQLIAEAYDLLKNGLGLTNPQLQEIFAQWNQTDELNSFLIEISADIFGYVDPETQTHLIDLILDSAGQKGTGRWTVVSSLDLGVPIPTIYAAVNARAVSSYKEERLAASTQLTGPSQSYGGDVAAMIPKVRDALYCSKMCSYAQGMALIAKASAEFNYNVNLPEVARIWKGGCIIRAGFLDKIKQAFQDNPTLPNLLLAPEFKQSILDRQAAWREVLVLANELGIAVPAFSSSLDYFDSYRRASLPQNLTQAQRDYFGAHTYERTDKPRGEFFHTEWAGSGS